MATRKKSGENSRNPAKLYERFKVGRPATYKNAEALWEEALAYFAWCDANPILLNVKKKAKRNSKDEEQAQEQAPTARPYTLEGLCLWLNMHMPWATFKQHCARRKDAAKFGIVLSACEEIVRNQQISGAMVGVYSERLTARLNGITEKTQVEVDQRQTTLSWEDYRKLLETSGLE